MVSSCLLDCRRKRRARRRSGRCRPTLTRGALRRASAGDGGARLRLRERSANALPWATLSLRCRASTVCSPPRPAGRQRASAHPPRSEDARLRRPHARPSIPSTLKTCCASCSATSSGQGARAGRQGARPRRLHLRGGRHRGVPGEADVASRGGFDALFLRCAGLLRRQAHAWSRPRRCRSPTSAAGSPAVQDAPVAPRRAVLERARRRLT